MNILYCLSIVLFFTTYALTSEFDHDSCGSLLPNLKNVNTGKTDRHRRRSTSEPYEDEKDESYALTPATSESPFKIEVTEKEYRRNRLLQVSIRGAEFNGFILQARSEGEARLPIGIFKTAPASSTLFTCHVSSDTVISKDTGGKENLQFTWQAPADSHKDIYFIATVVQKTNYWPGIRSEKLTFNPFPPNMDDCGETKSCYLQSSVNECLPDKCDYVVIAQTTEDNEIEFTIGGTIKEENGYIAVGFTMDHIKMSHMDISACIKKGSKIEVQQFLIDDWETGARRNHKVVESETFDTDGDTIWCRFRRPLHGPGSHMADLRQSLFQTFITGNVNDTNSDIILPTRENVTFVAEVWNHSHTVNVQHLIGHNTANVLHLKTWLIIFMNSLLSVFYYKSGVLI